MVNAPVNDHLGLTFWVVAYGGGGGFDCICVSLGALVNVPVIKTCLQDMEGKRFLLDEKPSLLQ